MVTVVKLTLSLPEYVGLHTRNCKVILREVMTQHRLVVKDVKA